MIDFKHGTFSNVCPAQDDEPSLEALGKMLDARDRRAAGVFTPAEQASQKIVELLLSGCPIVVDPEGATPGTAYGIDAPGVWGLPPTRAVVFHSEAERDRFMSAFRRRWSP